MREGEAKAREALLKKSVPQPKTPTKGRFTQKQLLLEAIQTEVSGSDNVSIPIAAVAGLSLQRFC